MDNEKKINLIVIDDEVNILNAVKRVLKNEYYGVFATTDYEEALNIMKTENVKVIISDQRMPVISGVELLKKVKEIRPDIIRILFTGYTEISIVEEAINKGEVYRFINKPWEDSELKAIIRDALSRYDILEHNRELTAQIKNQNDELVKLNSRLKGMYEAQKEFSSTVSHELRTPLASMKAMIDIVASGTAGPLTDEQKNFLERAKNNVDRLNRLINEILSLTKLESGAVSLKLSECVLNDIISEIALTYRPGAEKRNLYLREQYAVDLPRINVDQDKISQVVNNLVSNALKFTETGGVTVKTSFDTEKNIVSVCVSDTGKGIKEEDIPKLFKKFLQLGEPVDRNQGGTGLGLAISKEIISQHGGKIWVESKPGEGSSFCFVLPIKERREPDIATSR